MCRHTFANLQKIGKSLMLPVSVLPVVGILLGVGSGNYSWQPAIVSRVMTETGSFIFTNMPLLFAIGVAIGFTNNDGVFALASVVAYGFMVKTMSVVAPLVLGMNVSSTGIIDTRHLSDTGSVGRYYSRCNCGLYVQSLLSYSAFRILRLFCW
ncbi:PTS system glucose-specific EIICB component [Pantoea sp. Nvir]|nr:PTS system glucose-specific EIICB component [Pantoea sp. Nvir]